MFSLLFSQLDVWKMGFFPDFMLSHRCIREISRVPVIDRYIFKQLLLSFLIVLGTLSMIVWMATALRQLEVITAQGQALAIFLTITALALPMLIMHIAPFALFIACLFTLNKLSSDSELVVMSSAGYSERQLLRPFLMLAILVSLFAWLLSLAIVPASLRELRYYTTNVKADLIGTIIQPGKFTSIDKGLTFHVRDRATNGALLGVFVNDRRDAEMEMTYMSSKGLIIRTSDGTFLILENGQIIRRGKDKDFGSIIAFDRYAFNLSAFMGEVAFTEFTPSERTTAELLNPEKIPNATLNFLNRARAELHDRFATPLYAIAFVLIAFAALGRARTTRRNRARPAYIAILCVVILRVLGFSMSGLTQHMAFAVPLIYLVPLIGITGAFAFGPFWKTDLWEALETQLHLRKLKAA
jgi:lipopolysaccharide export system permease protein